MTLASPTLLTPTPLSPSKPKLQPSSPVVAVAVASLQQHHPPPSQQQQPSTRRRNVLLSSAAAVVSAASSWLTISPAAFAASDEEYVKETTEVINKVRSTITLDRNAPNVEEAVAELRETSNSWVAKYRKEKALLARASFRDMYSALNAVSGHYISFGPTAPLPAKRKARILEEMDTAEKSLLRGR
ncbi:Photosystem II repair protein PSB27-H1, chloroplastic [Linum perenne]